MPRIIAIVDNRLQVILITVELIMDKKKPEAELQAISICYLQMLSI